MDIFNYFEMQKRRIRDRHAGDTCIVFGGDSAPVCRTAWEILAEIDAMQGLNTRERYSAREFAEAAYVY